MFTGMKSSRAALAVVAFASVMLVPAVVSAAGGPYAVDDAAVLDAGTCQADAFASFGDESRETYVVAPACVFDFAPWLEAGVAVERARDGGAWGTAIAPGIKAVLAEVEEAGVSVGFSSGLVYDRTARSVAGYSLIGLLSLQLSEPMAVNLNVGYERDRAAGSDHLVWGAGTAFQASENLAFIAEAFGQDEGKTGFQAGFRPTIFNGHVDLDFVYGRNITGETGNWFSAGTSVRF